MVKRGFTLIELLVVLALVAMLLTIALPQYFHSVERSKESLLRQNLRTTRDAIDQFHGDLGRYPEDLNELVARRYLRSLPHDPITESNDTWVSVAPPAAEAGHLYDVKSSAAGRASDGTAFADW